MIKSKKSFFAIVFAFIIGICAIVLPFAINKKYDNVYAEPVVTGISPRSNLDVDQTWYLPFNLSAIARYNGYNSYYYLDFHFTVTKNVNTSNHMLNTFTFNFDLTNVLDIHGSAVTVMSANYIKFGTHTTNKTTTFTWDPMGAGDEYIWYFGSQSLSNNYNASQIGFVLYPYIDYNFDFDNIFYVEIWKANSISNMIQYNFVDVNNLSCSFGIDYCYSSYYSNFKPYTLYFLQEDALQNNEFYQMGYDYGYNNGNSDGYSNGYLVGQVAGEDVGYQRGYTAGVLAGNDYTFIGLIGSVVDAPIKAFTGLLNFEILGVNLSAFVYGLISICLVITVIKVIKGGDR